MAQNLQLQTIDNVEYYIADNLKIINPNYFYGTSKTIRAVIERKKIPANEYVFANIFRKEWKTCDISSKKAKLLISKNWSNAYILNTISVNRESENNNLPENNNLLENNNLPEINNLHEINNLPEINDLSEDNINVINTDQLEPLPPLLFLDNSEKFRDTNGNIFDIEVRGEKHKDKIYFKCSDISKAFEICNLTSSLRHPTSGYELNVHFKRFKKHKDRVNYTILTHKPSLYLTYEGVLRVLFVSRSGKARHFMNWATDKLFTIQMGTEESKEELGTDILGISIKSFRAVFKRHGTKNGFPCIYLLKLGSVGILRETFNISQEIDDKLIVYKYGFTKNMEKRLEQHNDDYGKMPNVKMSLEYYHFIDPAYVNDAEGSLRAFFKGLNKNLKVKDINEKGRNELVALNKDEIHIMKEQYGYIGSQFAGVTEELQKQITKLKHEIDTLNSKHEIELLNLNSKHEIEVLNLKSKYEIELLKNEKIIGKLESDNRYKDLELSMKDLIIENYKLKSNK